MQSRILVKASRFSSRIFLAQDATFEALFGLMGLGFIRDTLRAVPSEFNLGDNMRRAIACEGAF
jgi:hypothetical protein